MKPLTDLIMWMVWAVVLFTAANILILAFGLFTGNDTAWWIFFACLSVALLLWPDPNDRKINNSIKNPYNQN